MAYIPFGYKITEGRAAILPGDRQKILHFIGKFLSGHSVKESMRSAALPLSLSTAKKLLRRELYLGNGFYPQMFSKELFQKIQAELERRSHPPTNRPQEALKVRRRFKMRSQECPAAFMEGMDSAAAAAAIYQNILPDPAGRASMSAAEIQACRKALKAGKAERAWDCKAEQA